MGAELAQAITEMFEGLYDLRDANKFNVSPGYFQSYSSVDYDPYGKFYCNVKLHNKEEDENDISLVNVPLFYIGGANGALFFELIKGDRLMVFFSDRSLENWKPISDDVPQALGNPVKDSINHAIAIPIISAHKAAEVIDPPVNSAAIALRSKPSGKVDVSNGTDDAVSLLNDSFTEVIKGLKFVRDTITFSNGGGPTGPPSNGTTLSPIITKSGLCGC